MLVTACPFFCTLLIFVQILNSLRQLVLVSIKFLFSEKNSYFSKNHFPISVVVEEPQEAFYVAKGCDSGTLPCLCLSSIYFRLSICERYNEDLH